MKEDILEYFKTDRSFEAGKALYLKCPNRNQRTVAELNTRNNSAKNLEYVHYHLFLLTGLKDRVRVAIMQQPLQAKPVPTLNIVNTNPPTPPTTETKEQVLEALSKADVKVKQGFKLREQFPFLSGDNVPNVYKILVNDLITARVNFEAAHLQLHELVPQAELLQQTKDVVEPYKENKLIWEELEHYQKEGKPLGKHPIFKEMEMTDAVEKMTPVELGERKILVDGYIRKHGKSFRDAKEANDAKKMKSTKKLLKKYTSELSAINLRLTTL